jgi:hypothetical protein
VTTPLARAALAALCVLLANEATAREVRHPVSGEPAIVLQVPDDWTDKPDSDGNQIVVSADHSTSFVLSQGTSKGSLDDFAKALLHMANAAPTMNVETTSISGQAGFILESTMKAPQGTPLQLQMAIVRVGEKGYLMCTRMERQSNVPEQRQLADTVMKSVKIVGTGNKQ